MQDMALQSEHMESTFVTDWTLQLVLQNKAQQSERMLAEMAAQMQQLRVEKEELQGRNNLLESLVKVQQQQQHDSRGGRRLDATQV